jgi:hypothetical protein
MHLGIFNNLVFLLLLLSLAHISLFFTYSIILVYILYNFNYVDGFLVILVMSILISFSLLFYVIDPHKVSKNVFTNICFYQNQLRIFKHDMSNLCSILFLKSKDEDLIPVLEKMRLALKESDSFTKEGFYSAKDIIKKAVKILDYDYNIRVDEDFPIEGELTHLICFFLYILKNYVLRTSTIYLRKNEIMVSVKDVKIVDLEKLVQDKFSLEILDSKKLLKVIYIK